MLDIGCGAGIDLIVASRLVGATGEVHGIDLTAELTIRARANLESVGVPNGRVQVASSEAMSTSVQPVP